MEYVLIPRTKGFVLSCDTMRGTPEEDKKVEIIDLTLVFAGNKCTRPSLPPIPWCFTRVADKVGTVMSQPKPPNLSTRTFRCAFRCRSASFLTCSISCAAPHLRKCTPRFALLLRIPSQFCVTDGFLFPCVVFVHSHVHIRTWTLADVPTKE